MCRQDLFGMFLLRSHANFLCSLQMTLDLTTFYGCTVVDVVSIVGFVMEKQEGSGALIEGAISF